MSYSIDISVTASDEDDDVRPDGCHTRTGHCDTCIPVTVDPRLPAEAVIVAATCACGHPADYHTSHGCGYALTWCSCTTDVARLATKITGIGES